MADRTAAERQRRHRARRRAHDAGDHSTCGKSCDVTRDVTAVTPSPRFRTEAGRALWKDLNGDVTAGERRVLVMEACRITDRLSALDRLIIGDAQDWVELVEVRGNPNRQEIVIDKLLGEARQQATALARIVSELRQLAVGKPAAKPAPSGQPTGAVSGVVSLAAEAAKRRPAAAG